MRDAKVNGRQSGSYFSCIFASVGGEISFVGFLSLGPLISGFTLVLFVVVPPVEKSSAMRCRF